MAKSANVQYFCIVKRISKMRPEEVQPQTQCPKCFNFVRTPNFLIHQARCKGNSNLRISESIMQASRISRQRPESRIFSSRASRHRNSYLQQQQQKIPCPFCGYGQTLAELDTHPNNCSHRQVECNGCKNMYPMSLMQQHKLVCEEYLRSQRRRHRQERPPSRRHYEMQDASQRNLQIPPQLRLLMHIGQLSGMLGGQSRRRNPFMMEQQQQLGGRQRVLISPGFGMLINLLAGRGLAEDNGMSQQQIHQLPIKRYEQHGQQSDLCTICYCNFQKDQQCMMMPCTHFYHPECISKWLQKNDKCPVCKQSVRPRNQHSNNRRQPRNRSQRRNPRHSGHSGFIYRS